MSEASERLERLSAISDCIEVVKGLEAQIGKSNANLVEQTIRQKLDWHEDID
jgi:hypothetical protein